jgi:Holliday junction resolvase RusA-like endonuclease
MSDLSEWMGNASPDVRQVNDDLLASDSPDPSLTRPNYPVFTRPAKTAVSPTVERIVYMKAFGKARPRVTRNGTYMPRAYTRKKASLRRQFGASVPDGLVHLSVTAVRQLPKSWSNKKRERMDGRYTKAGPDTDNIAGAVMDALFPDDSRVVTIFCEKVWGQRHALVIEIAKAEDDE